MNIILKREDLIKTPEDKTYSERQQNIDAILVLSKLCEPGMMLDGSTIDKARLKIISLIDKI